MSKIGILCVDGLEEVECLTPVDFCRRAGIEVTTIAMSGKRQIMGAHQIHFTADKVYEDVDFSEMDAVMLPGGPGTPALEEDARVLELVKEMYESKKLVAAICAAPGVLAEAGILKDKKATAFPGCEREGLAAAWTGNLTEVDGNVITGRGPGAAMAFALEIIRYLKGEQTAQKIHDDTQMA